jgi:hypothetical protein
LATDAGGRNEIETAWTQLDEIGPHDTPVPLVAKVIGCGVGLAVTAWVLVRSMRTGRAGQAYGNRSADRKADPFNFWTSLGIGAGLFMAAAVLAGRWLLAQ